LHQLEQLQQAVFRCAVSCSAVIPPIPSASIRVFSVQECTAGALPAERRAPDLEAGLQTLYREQERRKRVLGWRRTHKDPFAGEWEQIFSWLLTNPERSSGDIFRELQRLSPGRCQPLHNPHVTTRDEENPSPSAGNREGRMSRGSDRWTVTIEGFRKRSTSIS